MYKLERIFSELVIANSIKIAKIPKNQSVNSQFVVQKSSQQIPTNNQWIINTTQARELVEQGATILDARAGKIFNSKSLSNAICINWKEFSQPQSQFKGKLLTDDKTLTEKLQGIGIFNNQPVIVFGDTINGWGEDGRIVWMLRTLGHQKTFLVDGGFATLEKADFPTVNFVNKNSPVRGDFMPVSYTHLTLPTTSRV